MVIKVAGEHVESLLSHLVAEGFPARRVGEDELDVLFPASPTLFAAAVELDDWRARTGASPVVRIKGSASCRARNAATVRG